MPGKIGRLTFFCHFNTPPILKATAKVAFCGKLYNYPKVKKAPRTIAALDGY